MFKSYFKTGYRSLRNNKGFTAINVLGLALGLTICLIIVFYVADELSYDRYNTKASRIYRVNEDLKLGNNKVQYAVCMPPLAQVLKNDYPYIENAVRLKKADDIFNLKKGTQLIRERGVIFADPGVFDVFTLPIISGDPASALKEPNTIVLTESSAKKYFNTLNILGQNIVTANNQIYKITGVIRDIPKQSHFNADFIISMSSLADSKVNQWLRSNYSTYVLFKTAADHEKLAAAFPALLKKYSSTEMQTALKLTIDQFEKSGSYFKLNLIPLTSIHLHSAMSGEMGTNSNIQYVYIFSAIALFILLIACVNFMNLSTARSANRAREVGVRKVLGSSRTHLIAQFLTESFLVTLAAAVIATVAVIVLLPQFNNLANKELAITPQMFIWLIPMLLGMVVFIGILAGLYPAFFLSAFQPIHVLKGKLFNGLKSSWLRSSLVVFQFFISIFLIIGTLVIYNQLNYIQNKNLGYNRNQVLVVKNVFELGNQASTFKQEIKQLNGVVNATTTGFLPTSANRNTSVFYRESTLNPANSLFPQIWYVDEDYIKTLDMTMATGRNFSAAMGTDSSGIIINETAAKFLGYKDPLNKTLYKSEVDQHNVTHVRLYHIIGMVKDFNFSSMHQNIGPVTMIMGNDMGDMSIRFRAAALPVLLSLIKEKWNRLSHSNLEYSFMDADFEATYRSEQRIAALSMIFTTLAVIIACLGLFGLVAYAAEQRVKEIGIRKVLGANVSAIVGMLSKDFLKLVIIAIIISIPAAWYVMQKWLQDFAYRTHIQWWIPVSASVITIVITLLTISYQSIKAAVANPIHSLRSE
jgi:putative ABC transport system permease protein